MITFKAIVISSNRRKDGTYPVKIRVTFKGVSRRLATTLVAKPTDLTRSLKIKSSDILNKTDELIGRMREAVKDISPFDLENWDVDRVVSVIKESLTAESFRLDFFDWAEVFYETKSPATADVYKTSVNSFARFLGKRHIDINDITRSLLLEYQEFIEKEPRMRKDYYHNIIVATSSQKKPGASSRYLSSLETIFNAAKDKYNDEDEGRILIPRSPFSKIDKKPIVSDGQKNIGVDAMQKIISAETDNPFIRTALDAFIVSFGLMGANMADLYNAKPFSGDTWMYNRQKTATRRADKAEMRVKIPEELHPYLERLTKGRGQWWLPALHAYCPRKNGCSLKANVNLKRWAEANDVQPFTFYAARHTWATLARQAGVEKATIDECLAHKGDYDMADIYAERSWEILQEANRKVLDLFTWS